MYIVRTLADVVVADPNRVAPPLARHLEKKVRRLHAGLGLEQPLEKFQLQLYGVIGLLEPGDSDLSGLGLPKDLEQLMPEWISHLKVGGESYFVLYILADNDCVIQAYLPEHYLPQALRRWLDEQPIEEEDIQGGNENDQSMPNPF